MPKYRKDINKVLAGDTAIIIPHGTTDENDTVTVTRIQFREGTDKGTVKRETLKVLAALGCTRTEGKLYIKVALNNFEDLNYGAR